jgi:tetratricopeptide (TPR) repeat protein
MSTYPFAQNLATAVGQHGAGRFQEAEVIYRNLLDDAAGQAEAFESNAIYGDALHLLGVLCGQTRREAEGIALLKRAIDLRPAMPQQHNNLGNLLRQTGRFCEAIDAFQIAVRLNPDYASAWNNLGNALKDDGRIEAAVEAYERSLHLRAHAAEVHSNLGIALREQGRLEAAIQAHRRAIALSPDSSEAFNNLGAALRDQGRVGEALAAHSRALELAPSSLSAMCNLGAAQRRAGKVDDAIATLRRALELDPNYADAHNNLASALIDQGKMEPAVESCARALALRPAYADAHGNLAIALAHQGRVEEAMRHARFAVEFMPAQPLAHWNLSMLLLLVGDFELGWREHEWRWKCPSMLKARQFEQPRWQGEPLEGRTIFLFSEQGFGDMLQFIRYASVVVGCGGRVIVECQPELYRLFEGLPGVGRLIRCGDTRPPFDVQCPLMSVPFVLQGRAVASPPVPYLAAPLVPEADTKWQIDRLAPLNVGLAWAGDPAHQNDRSRSIALHRLSPLLKLDGVRFHSLQKGIAAAEASELSDGIKMIDHSAQLTDFAGTASPIDHLDLVVTVDTAVAHLAGSMGKPTWILLPFMPDWRWMLHRPDSPWYPTVRLFRQTALHDWTDAIANATQALGACRRWVGLA